MRQGVLVTAGERLAVDCAVSWVGDLIEEAADGGLTTGGAEEATVQIRVEATRDPFETSGWRPLARGVLGHDRSLVLRNLLSIGFDLRVDVEDGTPRFTFRWRPAGRERAMALVLRSRFHLLARSALLRYPALWWAGTRGRAPLHASACTVGDLGVALLAGPGGVGKSTLVSKELAAGGSATCDNVCVADGASAWGVVEPLRVEGGGGRRMPHGRRETAMPGRVAVLARDRLGAAVRPGDRGEVAGHRHLHGTGTAPLLGLRGHPGGGDGHRPAPPPGRRGRGRVRRTRAGDPRHPPEPTRARVAGAARHRGPGGRYVDVKVLTTDRRPPSARVFESRDAPANPAVLELLGSKLVGADLASAPVVLPDFHHKSSMEMPSSIAVATHGTIRPTLTSSSVNCGMALIAFDADVPDQAAITRFYEAVRERFPHPTTRRRDLSAREVMRAAEEGGAFAADRYGVDPAGLSRMEKDGRIDLAPHGGIGRLRRELPWVVVQLARMRFGTIGPSNHFVELQRVEEVFDERAARLLGVRQGQLTLQYHGGGGVLAGQLGRLFGRRRKVARTVKAEMLMP